MIGFHDGYTLESKGENPATVTVQLNGYGEVALSIETRHGIAQAFLTPDDALDVALYLMRERRLGVRGSG